MTCREICDHSRSDKVLTMPTDVKRKLLDSLSDDSFALTNLCTRVLRGGIDQESSLTAVALRLHGTLGAIRTVAKDLSGDMRFMTTIAREVEKALSRICGLAPLILQTGDERLACLHPVLDVGESLNSLYNEVGFAIVR